MKLDQFEFFQHFEQNENKPEQFLGTGDFSDIYLIKLDNEETYICFDHRKARLGAIDCESKFFTYTAFNTTLASQDYIVLCKYLSEAGFACDLQ